MKMVYCRLKPKLRKEQFSGSLEAIVPYGDGILLIKDAQPWKSGSCARFGKGLKILTMRFKETEFCFDTKDPSKYE